MLYQYRRFKDGYIPMKISVLMVITYIINCLKICTNPCKYFQLNSPYFNGKKGIFSKIEMDRFIPSEWKLDQQYDDGSYSPAAYPVFVKPEWGQRAQGVFRADNRESLEQIRQSIAKSSDRIKYLIQQGANEQKEFEIFSILDASNKNNYAVLTITEAVNLKEASPVNNIYNSNTSYKDVTDQFSFEKKQQLWSLMGKIGHFSISRITVCANSIDEMLKGKFHVIEINLFTPLPLNVLDPKYNTKEIWRMIKKYMLLLAGITKHRDKKLEEKPVFTKIILYNPENKLLNFIRDRICNP